MMTTGKSADDAALDDVFASDRDRGGKSAPPEATETPATAPATPATPEPAPQAPAAPPAEPDPNANRHVPLSELLTEREKRKQEARLREEADARAREYESRVRDIERRLQAAQQPPAPPPNPLEDPEGAYRHQAAAMQVQMLNQRADFSELSAKRHYGVQAVDEAFEAASRAGIRAQFINSSDPYGDMVEWHKRQKTLAEVGDDPTAYRKRIEDEVRKKVLEELKTGAVPGSTQQPPPQRFPGSLADVTPAGNSQGALLTAEAMMGQVFGTDRNRK